MQRRNNAPPVRMERRSDHVVIHPRNILKAKAAVMLDGPSSMADTAVRRAEQALKGLSGYFDSWMEESAVALVKARDAARQNGPGDGRGPALHRAAHDIRGQATTLGYPLAARVGASLCRVLEDGPGRGFDNHRMLDLVDKHVDALHAIIREGMARSQDGIGETVAAEIEAVTERSLAGRAASALH